MLAEYLGGEQLLVGQVPRGVLVDAVVVAVLGLHLVRRHQHRLLSRAVDVLGKDVAANLGIGGELKYDKYFRANRLDVTL